MARGGCAIKGKEKIEERPCEGYKFKSANRKAKKIATAWLLVMTVREKDR